MMLSITVAVAAVLLSYSKVMSLKVLIYSPTLGHSHLQFIGKLADILVADGNYVHMLIPEWDAGLTGNGTKYAQRVTRLTPSKPSQYRKMKFRNDPFADSFPFSFKEASRFLDITAHFCEDFLLRKQLISELRADHYDIALTEIYDYCPNGIFELLDIKSRALLAATPISDLLADTWGFPSPASYVTAVFNSFVNAPKLSFFQRVATFANIGIRFIFHNKMHKNQNAIFRRIVREDFPDLKSLAQQATIAFVNSLPIIDIPRPITSKIIFIGGIANKETTKMSEPFASLYENVRKGVVVFSLGSLVDTNKIPANLKSDILLAFSRFPDYDFIVKMAVNDTERKEYHHYRNIHFFNWIEQVNLLNHPKTKAFITHAGLNSITEAAFSGTPVICVPLFADQYYNTAIVLRKRIGVHLDKKYLNADRITQALEKVLNDPSYAKAAKQVQQQIQHYPHNTTQLFLDWIHYAALFDSSSIDFNLYGLNLNLITYFSLDVIAFLAILLCSFGLVICFLAHCAYRKIRQIFRKLKKE